MLLNTLIGCMSNDIYKEVKKHVTQYLKKHDVKKKVKKKLDWLTFLFSVALSTSLNFGSLYYFFPKKPPENKKSEKRDLASELSEVKLYIRK